jgi:hypothetical protein
LASQFSFALAILLIGRRYDPIGFRPTGKHASGSEPQIGEITSGGHALPGYGS